MLTGVEKPTPFYEALAKAQTTSGVNIAYSGSSRLDAVSTLLRQAHSLSMVLGAAFEDAEEVNSSPEEDSVLSSLRGSIVADAIGAVTTLVGMASALVEETV